MGQEGGGGDSFGMCLQYHTATGLAGLGRRGWVGGLEVVVEEVVEVEAAEVGRRKVVDRG